MRATEKVFWYLTHHSSTMAMLCARCRAISFQAKTPESLRIASGPPNQGDFVFYALHETKESFLDSISAGCHLCIMINGQLGTHSAPDKACDWLNAWVVLRRLATSRNSRSVSVLSNLGGCVLNIIDPIQGLPIYHLL